MARGVKANADSVRLAPFVGVIDGTTGRPADKSPYALSTGQPQEVSPLDDLMKQSSSRWRLPVLVFCGKNDEGMCLDDEEYLGRPLEHGETCVVLSEAWVIDSVAIGRLLRMADYAKHGEPEMVTDFMLAFILTEIPLSASPGVDVDLPSLFLPSAFPPTYRISLPRSQDMLVTLLPTPNQEQDLIPTGPLLQVLGPFTCSDERGPAGRPLRSGAPSSYLGTSKYDKSQDDKLGTSHTLADSGRALAATDEILIPKTPERSQMGRLCNAFSGPYCHSSKTHDLVDDIKGDAQCAYIQPKLPPPLEIYIHAKKQSHIEHIQEDLATWNRQRIDARDRAEEGRIDMELDEDGGYMTDAMKPNTDEEDIKLADNHASATAAAPESATEPLALEASILLELLPPLKLSRRPDSEGEFTDTPHRSSHAHDLTSNIPYYPYLTLVASDDNSTPAPLVPSSGPVPPFSVFPGSFRHGPYPQTRHEILPEPISQKRVIAFHNAGYGVGWMDFEACADWVCVPKQKRSG
ncbi:hypothetical protein QFC22_002601 [Naganishia vaughanmartiniae]|uniref:Uncharacterized protein n=1 Tax=Naganishia vaughanmartiniae TaxID=1424756 RepID=A0ACC2X9F1_9TREE|nr:hypothetical protein QFC22_002601 [Naganishia vaughanmartiniae]